jgi:hypothetical protein
METAPGEFYILEAKEQLQPSVRHFLKDGNWMQYDMQAKRTHFAMKHMLSEMDEMTGIMSGFDRSFLVRRIPPRRGKISREDFKNGKDIENFLEFSALATAQAHCRSSVSIPGSMRDFASEAYVYFDEHKHYKESFMETCKELSERFRKYYEIFTKQRVDQ